MSDPAVEAARRAGRVDPGWPKKVIAEEAAREALRPIRDELNRLAEATEPPCSFETWAKEFGAAIDRISVYCFSPEELSK